MPKFFPPTVAFVGVLFWALTAPIVQAADDKGAYAVDGVGARPCADLSAAYDKKDEKLLKKSDPFR